MIGVEKDGLLEALDGALLAGVPDAPSHAVATVRRRATATQEAAGRVDIRRNSHRGGKAVAVVLIIVALIAAAVVGYLMPRPVRDVAYRAGLPVESSRLLDAREALHDLAVAITNHDRSAVQKYDDQLIRLVESLSAEEHPKIDPEARQLHLRAADFLAESDSS